MDGFPPYALLLFIPVLWLLVGWGLSKASGWNRLAKMYRAKTRCEGEVYHFQSCRMGPVSYSGCWSIFLTSDGFFISMLLPFRFGHPPLFIPWKDIHDAELRSCLGYEWMKYQVGRPTIATIQLPKKIVERVLAREDFRTL